MTELERKALLGDQEAQRECTEKGIVLPCSRCGKQGATVKYSNGDYWYQCPYCHSSTGSLSNPKLALAVWNTRPAPPIGRCVECSYREKATVNNKGFLICPASGMEITNYDFCSYFEPKERDRNELD